MRASFKYCLTFVAGMAATKVLAYVGHKVLLQAAYECVEKYPGIPGFLVPVCMQAEHPVLVMVGKLLNLTF